MYRFIVLLMVVTGIYTKDPCNGVEFHGRCYWRIQEKLSFYDANLKCSENNGTLAEVPDAESNQFIAAYLMSDLNFTWIGVKYDWDYLAWISFNRIIQTYTSWENYFYKIIDETAKTHCVGLKIWMDAKSCEDKIGFLCSNQNKENCSFYMTRYGESCFWKNTSRLRFWEAEASCQQMGGHLASVPDNMTFSFLQTSILHDIKILLWIGIHYIQEKRTYVNMFNKTQNFTAWKKDEPNITENYAMPCAASKGSGWYTFPCDFKYPSVCSRRAGCYGSDLPLTRTTQLLNPFVTDPTNMTFELETEVKIRNENSISIMLCSNAGFWKVYRSCACPCSRLFVNDAEISIENKILRIKQELQLNKSQMSKSKRQKISVRDTRSSAFAIGSLFGIGIITTFLLGVLISDLPLLLRQVKLKLCPQTNGNSP